MAVKITIRPNGPYLVEGEIELVDVNGNKVDTNARGPRIALCRCGASVTKPFCDGTHSKIGFQAAEAALRRSGKTYEVFVKADEGHGFYKAADVEAAYNRMKDFLLKYNPPN